MGSQRTSVFGPFDAEFFYASLEIGAFQARDRPARCPRRDRSLSTQVVLVAWWLHVARSLAWLDNVEFGHG